MEQAELVRKIVSDYKIKKNNNRSFSLRAYSRYLDVNVSILSRIMNGKLPVSENVVKRLVERNVLEQKDYVSFVELKKHKLKYKYDYLDTEDSCISSAFRMLGEGFDLASIKNELSCDDYGENEILNVLAKFNESLLHSKLDAKNMYLKLFIDSDIENNVRIITERFYEDLIKYVFLRSKKFDKAIDITTKLKINQTDS